MVNLMFDTELTEQKGDVPAPFSSETPPPEIRFFIASNHVFFWHR
jgi:hypothetical protein